MRALVTGATGFLGSHLVHQLRARGDAVTALVRTTSDRSRLDGVDVRYVPGDVTDATSVQAALTGVDQVFHCAAVVEFGPRDPSVMERINVGGTENVLSAAADRGIPAVHVSSLAALGATPASEPPQDERYWNPGPPAAVYEDHKRRGHLIARGLAAGGAPVRIAMPGGIYGEGDQSTLYDLIRAYSLWPLPLGYFPEIRQSTVNVDDCADALIRMADGGNDGDEYVVAAEVVTIREWIDTISLSAGHRPPSLYLPTAVVRALGRPGGVVAGWLGRSPTMVPEIVAVATHDCAYTGQRARRELGWSPRPLDRGMAEMARSIQRRAAVARRSRRATAT